MKSISQPSKQNILARSANIITVILLITSIFTAFIFIYFGYSNNQPRLYILPVIITIIAFIDIYVFLLIRQNRTNLAMFIIGLEFTITVIATILIVEGIGIILAVLTWSALLSISGLAMTSKYSSYGIGVSLAIGIALFFLDSLLTLNRIKISGLENYAALITAIILISFAVLLIRAYNRFSLQAKITLGTLLTAGIIASILTIFALQSANSVVDLLARKYEASVNAKIEAQILNTVQVQAFEINDNFEAIVDDTHHLTEYIATLDPIAGDYWNASERLIQLPNGQYGNSPTDASSIYIPNTVGVTEEILADLNKKIYLDFIAPDLIGEDHVEVVAVYYISKFKYTIYYPNIELAKNLPADFDPTADSFYTIATPEENPEKLPRWTLPYNDPAGAGLIVTVSIPVYSSEGEFEGVIGSDIKLDIVAEKVADIKVSETDFTFLIDEKGFIIYMPERGYQAFGIEPEEVTNDILTRQSIFDTEFPNLEFIAQRIVFNQSNLEQAPVNGVDTYVSSVPLDAIGYKIVNFAPTAELNSEIINTIEEITTDVETAIQNASILLLGLFIGAIFVSLLISQAITRPIKRLTTTVEQIASGDLSARANIETDDQIGTLANTFNLMSARLSDTLTGLEEKVSERTSELEKSNQSIAQRAAQFEAISKISGVISSSQTLNHLLPQITESISQEFGFYHVGIFLVDVHKEYAVLVATNSAGGKRMLDRNHRLRVGETGIVGFVTRSGRPRIALDVGADAVFFNNPDLPETSSEIALPLRAESEILGALDVQSTQTNAFSEEDVNILSVLADQVSIAIQNARLYQQSREALEQAELSAAQLTEQQWSKFLGQQEVNQYSFDGVDAKPVVRIDKDTNNIVIPLILRGAQIGTLKLATSDAKRVWDEDEIAIAQATAERTTIAIESARLLQEAQKRATKEQTIGQISAKIGNLVNLDNILETTLQELGNTIPDTEIAIQFNEVIE